MRASLDTTPRETVQAWPVVQRTKFVCYVDGTLNRPHQTRISILLRRHKLRCLIRFGCSVRENTFCEYSEKVHNSAYDACTCTGWPTPHVGMCQHLLEVEIFGTNIQAASVHGRRLLHVSPERKSTDFCVLLKSTMYAFYVVCGFLSRGSTSDKKTLLVVRRFG